jgi:hypothetical protein
VDDHCHPEEGAHPEPSATRGSPCADRRIFIGNGRGFSRQSQSYPTGWCAQRRDSSLGARLSSGMESFAWRLPQNDTVCRIRITTLFADSVSGVRTAWFHAAPETERVASKFTWPPAALPPLSRSRHPTPARASSAGAPCRRLTRARCRIVEPGGNGTSKPLTPCEAVLFQGSFTTSGWLRRRPPVQACTRSAISTARARRRRGATRVTCGDRARR